MNVRSAIVSGIHLNYPNRASKLHKMNIGIHFLNFVDAHVIKLPFRNTLRLADCRVYFRFYRPSVRRCSTEKLPGYTVARSSVSMTL